MHARQNKVMTFWFNLILDCSRHASSGDLFTDLSTDKEGKLRQTVEFW